MDAIISKWSINYYKTNDFRRWNTKDYIGTVTVWVVEWVVEIKNVATKIFCFKYIFLLSLYESRLIKEDKLNWSVSGESTTVDETEEDDIMPDEVAWVEFKAELRGESLRMLELIALLFREEFMVYEFQTNVDSFMNKKE